MNAFDVVYRDATNPTHAGLIGMDVPDKAKSTVLTEIDLFIRELAEEFEIAPVPDLCEMLEHVVCKIMHICKETHVLGDHVPLPRHEYMHHLTRIFGTSMEHSIKEAERWILREWHNRRLYLKSLLRSAAHPSRFMQPVFNNIIHNGRWTGSSFMCSQLPYDVIGHSIRCHIHDELAAVANAYGLNTIRSIAVSATDCSMSWQVVLNTIYARAHSVPDDKFEQLIYSAEYAARRQKTIEAIYSDWGNRYDAIIKFVGFAPGTAEHFKHMVTSGQYKYGGFMCTALSTSAGYDRAARTLAELRISEIAATMTEYAKRICYTKNVSAGNAWSTLINVKTHDSRETNDLLVKVYSDWKNRWEILGVTQ